MLSKQAFVLTQLLGPNDPTVQSLVWAANNPEMQQTAEELLEGLARSRGLDPQNPPAFGLPVGLSPSDYPVGRAKCGELLGDEIGPSDQDLTGHGGVFGVSGLGKTTVINLILLGFTKGPNARSDNTFLVLAPHDEYRNLLPLFSRDELLWLEPDDLAINPLEVPMDSQGRRVMSPDKWAGNIRGLLRLAWLNEPSLNLCHKKLIELYEEQHVFDTAGDYPSVSDLVAALERQKEPPGSDGARAREKVLDRLCAIRSMLPGLDVRRSRNIHGLFGRRSAILDLAQTSDLALPLLFNLLVLILECAFNQMPGEPTRHILVVEEASLLLGGQIRERTADLNESRGLSVLRSLRKAGFSGWIVNQLVSDLDAAVVGNLSSVCCLRLVQNRCIAQAASTLGLQPWQQRELALLPAREAIVRLSRHPGAIHLAVNDAINILPDPRCAPSREEARSRSKPVLDSIPFVPGPSPDRIHSGVGNATSATTQITVPPPKPKPSCAACQTVGVTLDRDEHKDMEAICEEPADGVLDRCDRVRMTREEESVARRALINMGLVRCAGSVGRSRLLFEPTSGKGTAWAASHAIAIPAYHGGIVHEFCRRKTEQRLARIFPGAKFLHRDTGQPGGVRPDSLIILPGTDGQRLAIQVVVANQPEREAINLLKLCGITPDTGGQNVAANGAGWIDRVLSVAINKRVQASVESAVGELNGGQLPDKLTFIDMESVLRPSSDLASILQKDVS